MVLQTSQRLDIPTILMYMAALSGVVQGSWFLLQFLNIFYVVLSHGSYSSQKGPILLVHDNPTENYGDFGICPRTLPHCTLPLPEEVLSKITFISLMNGNLAVRVHSKLDSRSRETVGRRFQLVSSIVTGSIQSSQQP